MYRKVLDGYDGRARDKGIAASTLIDTPVPIGLQVLRMDTLPLLAALLLHAPRLPLEALGDVGMLEGCAGFEVGTSRGKVVRRVALGLMSPDPFAQPQGPVLARRLDDPLHARLLVALAAVLDPHPLQDVDPLVPGAQSQSWNVVPSPLGSRRGSPQQVVDLGPHVRVLLPRQPQALGERLAVLDGRGAPGEGGRDEGVRGVAHLDDAPGRARPPGLRVAPADLPPDEPLRGDLADRLEEHRVPAFRLREAAQHLLRR